MSKATKPLTPDEERVIRHKGTEAPFSGKYWKHAGDGTYACRQCGAELFPSSAKFDSGTGWPSFDAALPGAVREVPDADGQRIEIVCAHCGGHLGHIFRGESMTPKDTRHCVNSASLAFCPAAAGNTDTPLRETAIFAGGCFWGVEYHFRRVPGVHTVTSGYIGGTTEHPTYEQVCSGTTGHAEAVRIEFDPKTVSYETLARLFFEIHDPAQLNRQGPDRGTQYRSEVFHATDEQKAIALRLIDELRRRGVAVVTRVSPAGPFWPAEAYHQQYYERTGKTPYCHMRVRRFDLPIPETPPAGTPR